MTETDPPPMPGELVDTCPSGDYYVIPSPDDHWGPLVIKPVAPRRRDFWRVLFGRWRPALLGTQGWTLKGYDRCLKGIWTEERIGSQLDAASPLLGLIDRPRPPD